MGNQGSAESSEPIVLDIPRPRGRILGLDPSASVPSARARRNLPSPFLRLLGLPLQSRYDALSGTIDFRPEGIGKKGAIMNTRGRQRRINASFLVLVITISSLCSGEKAQAQAIEPGDLVVLASNEDTLKVGRRVVASGKIHRVFTVGQVNGEWFWIEAPDVAGWVKGDRVLPFDQALQAVTDRIEAGNPTSEDFNRRGLLWADRGRSDLAEADFDEAIRREPEWPTPWLDRGNMRRASGRLDEAIADLSHAGELSPQSPLPPYNLGLALLDQGSTRPAYDAFSLAIRIDPNHAASRFNRSATALALGLEGASTDAEAYLALVGWYEERSPYAAMIAALEHRRQGRTEQSNGLLQASFRELDPERWPSPVLEYMLGKRDLEGLLAAADTPDRQAEARAYAGLSLQFQGQTEAARPLLQWVVDRADPTRIPHLLARSVLAPAPGSEDPGPAEAGASAP